MILSNILAKTEMIGKGLSFFDLMIGVSLASFQKSGNVPDSIEDQGQWITHNVCCVFYKHYRDLIRSS